MKCLGAALSLLLIATAVFAQSAEYGRAGSDEIALPFKKSGTFSGSFGLSTSNGGFAGKSFGGTIGGALVADKLWFFGTMQRDDTRRMLSNLSLNAPTAPRPSTSLSLRYTGLISSRNFFNATVTSRQSQPAFFRHW